MNLHWKPGVVAAVAALLAQPAAAVPYVYPYNLMTAEEVVNKLLVKPRTDGDYAERDAAYAYVAGIKDATQGDVWCFQPGLKPDELIYETMHAVKRNNAPAALKANAAGLVLKELRRQYPCATDRKERP
jgi:hypothetical protein